jgi:hypothetical protein
VDWGPSSGHDPQPPGRRHQEGRQHHHPADHQALLLSSEKSYQRKLKEAFLAYRLEKVPA